jgi:putative membrane protein
MKDVRNYLFNLIEMKNKIKLLLPIAAILFSCNSNQPKDPVEKADSTNNEKMDTASASIEVITTDQETSMFLVTAADGGMAEVELGMLAQQNGMNAAVKSFGSMMVHEHSGGNSQVKILAALRNVTLPANLGEKNQELKTKLAKLKGAAFDKEYIDAMIKDHKEDIFEFEKVRDRTGDAAVKDFAVNTLPMLQRHLDSAQAIQKRMK